MNRSLSDQALQPPFTQPTTTNEPRNAQNANANTTSASRRAPSAGWLKNPAWIDGGVNPPQYYYSHEEIDAACRAAGVEPPPRYTEAVNLTAPSDLISNVNNAMGMANGASLATQYDILSLRVSPTPVPTNSHYRAVGPVGNNGNNIRNEPPRADVCPSGHLINVTHVFTAMEPPAGSRNMKIAGPKKKQTTMLANITLEGITRVDFITAFLTIHGLHTQYAPGVHSGPAFKLSWTGSSGEKGNAPTFLTDENFGIALGAVLKKDKKKIQVSVEFDTDTMMGYRIQQPVPLASAPVNNGEEELVYGNRIPHVSQFNDAEQVNGRFVLEIKKRWPCAAHQGEHGEPGHCFITASGEHLRLNPLRLKMWAAAMSSGDVTKHEPPCTEAFDGPRNGQAFSVKTRGRTGAAGTATAPGPANNDMMALLMASLIPVIGGLARKRSHSESPSRYASHSHASSPKRARYGFQTPTRNHLSLQTPMRPRREFQTPRRDCLQFQSPLFIQPLLRSPPSTQPAHQQSPASPASVPAPGFELRVCLRDFAELESIDMTEFEIALRAEDFTPDLIALADESATMAIRAITGATCGRLMRLKLFCKKWQTNYESKLLSGFYTTYELE